MNAETKSLQVVIVEDDDATRMIMEETLQPECLSVKSFSNAEDALKYLEGNDCSLIFLDITLPGMDGLEFCRTLRKTDPETYIVASTGKDKPEDLKKILKAGANDYIAKPFNPKVLIIRAGVAAFTISQMREKFQTQKDLIQSEERHRIISENSRDVVLTQNAAGMILYISPGVENLLGYQAEGLVGKPIETLIHSEDLHHALPKGDSEILNGSLEEITEFRMKDVSGNCPWVEALHKGIQNKHGKVTEWITYIRESEGNQSIAQKLQVVETLLENPKMEVRKYLNQLARAFEGRCLLVSKSKDTECLWNILGDSEPHQPTPKKSLKLLWQNHLEDELHRNSALQGIQPHIIAKGLNRLCVEETHGTWQSGIIQPVRPDPRRDSDPSLDAPEEISLIILRTEEIAERNVRAHELCIKLAGHILARRIRQEKPAGESPRPKSTAESSPREEEEADPMRRL
jgi:PAS domain S-box-containing protein